MRRSIVVLAALALVLTGCAEQHPAAPPPTSTPPRIPVSMSPSASPSASPMPSSTTGGLVQLTVHHGAPPAGVRRGPAWEPVSATTPASTSVEITWTDTPSPVCGSVQDVWVRETPTAVVIDLVRSARQSDVMCPAVLVPRRAEVPLPSALGSRVLQQDASSPGPKILPSPVKTTGSAG